MERAYWNVHTEERLALADAQDVVTVTSADFCI